MSEPLLRDLTSRGVEFWRDGHTIRWRAPKGALAPSDLENLRERSDQLLDLLDAVEEHSAIREFDGGQSREDAERRASTEVGLNVTELKRLIRLGAKR